jgi:hypothetical protein
MQHHIGRDWTTEDGSVKRQSLFHSVLKTNILTAFIAAPAFTLALPTFSETQTGAGLSNRHGNRSTVLRRRYSQGKSLHLYGWSGI